MMCLRGTKWRVWAALLEAADRLIVTFMGDAQCFSIYSDMQGYTGIYTLYRDIYTGTLGASRYRETVSQTSWPRRGEELEAGSKCCFDFLLQFSKRLGVGLIKVCYKGKAWSVAWGYFPTRRLWIIFVQLWRIVGKLQNTGNYAALPEPRSAQAQ